MTHYIRQYEDDDTWSLYYGSKLVANRQTEGDLGELINILQEQDAMNKPVNECLYCGLPTSGMTCEEGRGEMCEEEDIHHEREKRWMYDYPNPYC